MKVNITGSGNIPGVNKNAPAYNLDLEKSQISRILNFRQFRVFGVGTGLITRENLDAAFEASIAEAKKAIEATVVEAPKQVEKKPEPKKVAKKKEVAPIEKPVVEEKIEEPTIVGIDLAQNEDVVVEAPAVKETIVAVTDTSADEVEVVEEKEPEFRPRNKKNKKKKYMNPKILLFVHK